MYDAMELVGAGIFYSVVCNEKDSGLFNVYRRVSRT